MSGATVLSWAVLVATLSFIWSEDVQVTNQCDAMEELTCGDVRSRFRLRWCQPDKVGLKKIIDVQLNTGYPHKYCRRLDSDMFGVGPNKTNMWVSNFCYGTFNVCIELEQSIVSTEHDTGIVTTTDPNSNEQTIDYAEATHISTDASYIHGLENSTTDSTNTLVDAPGRVTGTRQDKKTSNYNTTTAAVTQGAHKVTADNNTAMDPVLKIILMAGIATGGLVLLLMICIAAYMIHSCKRKTSADMYDKSSAPKYRPKLSTAALVTSDCLNEHTNGLYDFIPFDRTFPNTITFNRTPSVSNRPKAQNKDMDGNSTEQHIVGKTENHEYFTLAKEDVCGHCAPKLQHTMDSNIAYSHTREVLQQRRTAETFSQSHTHGAHVHSNNDIYTRRQSRCGSCNTESVYDRLMSVPRASVSDGAEYHHLGTFSRERKMTVDMSTQTEIDELK